MVSNGFSARQTMSTIKCHGNFRPQIYLINLRFLNSNDPCCKLKVSWLNVSNANLETAIFVWRHGKIKGSIFNLNFLKRTYDKNFPRDHKFCNKRNILCFKSWLTVNNKNTQTPCFSTLRFSCISPEPIDLQKLYLHFFISIFESSPLEQEFSKFDGTISWYWQNINFPIKS